MNTIFKPFILSIILTMFLAILIGQVAGYFLPNNFIGFVPKVAKINDIKFDICSAFKITNKDTPKTVIKKDLKKTSGIFLLKDFSISATFLDGANSMVIIRDGKGGIFLELNESYKKYKLVKVFSNKAKFEKNKDIYFAFLTPKDEKEFEGVAKKTIIEKTTTSRQKVTATASREMFEDIKYKNGKYFIPKDMLASYKNMNKIFSSIAIQAYNINNYIKFKVTFVSNSSVFAKMGLRRYDYIIKINDADFKSISEPIKYFQDMENIKELSLTILRGNETKELKYEIY